MITEKTNTLLTSRHHTHRKAVLALSFVCFFWGTTWVVSRQGVRYIHPLQLASIRQIMAGLLYILFFLYKGAAWPKGREWVTVFILSMLNFFLTNGLTTWGVKYISGGLAAIIAAVFPLWLVFIGLFSKSNSSTSPKAIAGFLLGFGGICIIFYDHLKDFLNEGFRFGIFISVTASLTWAFGTLYTKKKAAQFNPYFSIGLQMFISGLMLSGVSWASGKNIPLSSIPWQAWTAMGYLATIGSVFTFFAYLYALQHLPTAQVSIYAYINPVVAVLLDALFFREKLTIYIAMGGLVTLLGIYLVNESFRKKNGLEAPAEG